MSMFACCVFKHLSLLPGEVSVFRTTSRAGPAVVRRPSSSVDAGQTLGRCLRLASGGHVAFIRLLFRFDFVFFPPILLRPILLLAFPPPLLVFFSPATLPKRGLA